MKVLSTKTVKVTSRTLEILKRPKDRNLASRNVSISEYERAEVTVNDTVIIKIHDSGDNLVAEATYTGHEFHRELIDMDGYYLLGY